MCRDNVGNMNFNNYKALTSDILSGILKSKLLLDFSLKTFDSFPNNLHQSVRHSMDKSFNHSLKEREAYLKGEYIETRDKVILEGDRLLFPFIDLLKLEGKKSKNNFTFVGDNPMLVNELKFHQQILEQNLVYFVGIIEGYIYDSVRVLYSCKPNFLGEHNLSLGFSEIIKYNNIDDIKTKMVEMAVGRKWSEGGFSNRIEKLRKKFGILLDFKKELQNLLDEANLLRNCILHNGSKVSTDYLKDFGKKKNLQLNAPIEVSPYFIDAIYYLSLDFVKLLFIKTSEIAWDKTKLGLDFSNIGPCGYYKDVMMKKENWIYQELHDNGII